MAGLDFSAIRVPGGGGNGGNIGSPSGSLQDNSGAASALPTSPISIGMNDDPAMVRDAFFKNPDQLALVSTY